MLRVLRVIQEPKITQHELARRSGISRSRYWQIEAGYGSEPSQDEKNAVAAALGVKASDILWPDLSRVRGVA